jgi:membrane-bound ClpP family serine protease
MDSYAIFAILLMIAGLAVLAAEVFIPSGGLLFCVTVVILAGSVYCAHVAWGKSDGRAFWGFCLLLLMMIPTALVGAFSLLPRTPFGRKMLLEAPELETLEPYAKETAKLELLVGRDASTQTLLNPGGMVLIDGERYHAFTDGLLLEPNTAVEVAAVRGTRLLVGPRTEQSSTADSASIPPASPLDFEFPQS